MKRIRLMVVGFGGRLGSAIAARAAREDGFEVSCGISRRSVCDAFPVYRDFSSDIPEHDVIIDASHPHLLRDLLAFASARRVPAVICTTGHDVSGDTLITEAAKYIPVLKSGNMSLGINLLLELVRRAAQVLDGYDAEIVETHRAQKLDSPSQTALMLADEIKSVRGDMRYVYDRHCTRKQRGDDELGIHSIRCGEAFGEHNVIFAGTDEIIELRHRATSCEIYAAGALRCAEFVSDALPGYYSMRDVLSNLRV